MNKLWSVQIIKQLNDLRFQVVNSFMLSSNLKDQCVDVMYQWFIYV